MNFKSFKLWINIITIASLVILIYFLRDQIAEAFNQLRTLKTGWLLMVPVIQLVGYLGVAKFYQSYFKTLNEKVSLWNMYKVGLEMNFVNLVFPSGGASGFGYFGLRMKNLGVPVSKATLTQVTRYSLTFLTFIVYLGVALILLALFGSASRLMILISSTLIFLVFLGAGLLIYIISSSQRIKSFTAFLPKLVNKIVGFFRKGKKQTIDIERVEALFEDLHKDYLVVRKNWRNLRAPFLWTMLITFCEVATIFVVYLAFGSLVNPGAIIIAYAVSNIAGLIAIIPGGVGVYESIMTLVMASSGVPKALALSATLVYRVLNMAIFIPVGFIFYQIALRKNLAESPREVSGPKV